MFIGHYAAAYAIKRAEPRLSLATLFLAVQFLDLLFMSFVLVGAEKMRIVPGITRSNPYDLYFMPFSHGLAGAIGFSLALAGVTLFLTRDRQRTGWIALASFSHWPLDWIMHRPDMPIWSDASLKVGLGLWNAPIGAVGLELALFVAAWLMYRSVGPAGGRPIIAFVLMAALLVLTPGFPHPTSDVAFAVQALGAYAVLAALAGWSEKTAIR